MANWLSRSQQRNNLPFDPMKALLHQIKLTNGDSHIRCDGLYSCYTTEVKARIGTKVPVLFLFGMVVASAVVAAIDEAFLLT